MDSIGKKSNLVIEEMVKDQLLLKGRVILLYDDGDGWKLHWDDPNVIVNNGRRCFAHLLGGDSNYSAKRITLGLGGHDGDPINGIIAPSITDTSLENGQFSKDIQTKEYSPSGQETTVTFGIVLEKEEGNGSGIMPYTEAGLIAHNGYLIARETFPALTKTPTRRIGVYWSIVF